MTSDTNNTFNLQDPLRGLPEELSLEDVRQLVERFPPVPPAVRRFRWFSLNSLLVAVGALLLLLLSFLFTAPPAPEMMPGIAAAPPPHSEPAQASSITPKSAASSGVSHRTFTDEPQPGEGLSIPSSNKAATAPDAAWPATRSTMDQDPVTARQNPAPGNTRPPEHATPAPPAQSGNDFHVVVHTTDRRLRYVFCVQTGSLAKPGVHDEGLLIRTEVVHNGSFTWHATGGQPPYRVVSLLQAAEGTNCVTVKDADGHVAEACGVIKTTSETVTENCNTTTPDTSGSSKRKNISNGACPTCPLKPAPTPHDSIAPPPDTTKVKPRDPFRSPSPGPVVDTTGSGPRPDPQPYRPPVKLPNEPPPAPRKPGPRKEPSRSPWTRTPDRPNPPLHRNPPMTSPDRVSPMPSGGNSNPHPAPPPPVRHNPDRLKR